MSEPNAQFTKLRNWLAQGHQLEGGTMIVRERKKKLEAIEGLKMKVNLCDAFCKGIGELR